MRRTVLGLLALSLILNVALAAGWLVTALEGYAEMSNGRLGVLAREVPVGQFGGAEVLLTLPKGLAVREASASGMGWFEPYRFRLVVTSEDPDLVDYSPKVLESIVQRSEFYSADVHKNRVD